VAWWGRRDGSGGGVEVHLVEPVPDDAARDDLEAVEELDDLGAAVGLDEADDDVRAPIQAAVRLSQHGEGLAGTRRHAEVDAQLASPGHLVIVLIAGHPPRPDSVS
jgi:hypothetical protein